MFLISRTSPSSRSCTRKLKSCIIPHCRYICRPTKARDACTTVLMGVLICDEIPAQIPGPNEHHRATAATPYMVPTRPGRLRSSHRRKPVWSPPGRDVCTRATATTPYMFPAGRDVCLHNPRQYTASTPVVPGYPGAGETIDRRINCTEINLEFYIVRETNTADSDNEIHIFHSHVHVRRH